MFQKQGGRIIRMLAALTATLSFLMPATASSVAPTGLYLSTATTSLTTGQVFTVDVHINSAAAIDTVHAPITYPANLVQMVNISPTSTSFDLVLDTPAPTSGN